MSPPSHLVVHAASHDCRRHATTTLLASSDALDRGHVSDLSDDDASVQRVHELPSELDSTIAAFNVLFVLMVPSSFWFQRHKGSLQPHRKPRYERGRHA